METTEGRASCIHSNGITDLEASSKASICCKIKNFVTCEHCRLSKGLDVLITDVNVIEEKKSTKYFDREEKVKSLEWSDSIKEK